MEKRGRNICVVEGGFMNERGEEWEGGRRNGERDGDGDEVEVTQRQTDGRRQTDKEIDKEREAMKARLSDRCMQIGFLKCL